MCAYLQSPGSCYSSLHIFFWDQHRQHISGRRFCQNCQFLLVNTQYSLILNIHGFAQLDNLQNLVIQAKILIEVLTCNAKHFNVFMVNQISHFWTSESSTKADVQFFGVMIFHCIFFKKYQNLIHRFPGRRVIFGDILAYFISIQDRHQNKITSF